MQASRIRRLNALKNSRSQTPERRTNINPEERKAQHTKPAELKSASQRIDHSALLTFGARKDPGGDVEVQRILRLVLPREQEMVPGRFFKESLFPRDTLEALASHPAVSEFDAEHALFTVEDSELKAAFDFLFNSHPLLQ